MRADGRGISVLIADDKPLLRDALADLIGGEAGLCVVGTAGSAEEAAELARLHRPDVALLDVRMPGGGPSAARAIRELSAKTQILALSAHEDRPTLLEMIRAGAVGYLVKGVPASEVLEAIRRSMQGQASLSVEVTKQILGELATRLEIQEHQADELSLKIARLRLVLDGDGPAAALQSIADLATGRVVGAEALARFEVEPRRGPAAWFGEAEQVGLGAALETSAVRAAVRRMADLPEDAYLSVNVSPMTVLLTPFLQALDRVDPERLVLEVTEHAPIEDYDGLELGLRPLRDRGVRLAVDDAGAGFASLRHILRLRPEFIKLDLSLTRDVDTDPARHALAAALTTFAAEIGAAVVAEGVETASELRALRDLGVAFGQGYFLARPSFDPVLAHVPVGPAQPTPVLAET